MDNIEDPDQMTNMYGRNPELDETHAEILRQFLREAEDPFAGWGLCGFPST